METTVDTRALTEKVQRMYRQVAENPWADFHFELGEQLALHVGYDPTGLATVPSPAVETMLAVQDGTR